MISSPSLACTPKNYTCAPTAPMSFHNQHPSICRAPPLFRGFLNHTHMQQRNDQLSQIDFGNLPFTSYVLGSPRRLRTLPVLAPPPRASTARTILAAVTFARTVSKLPFSFVPFHWRSVTASQTSPQHLDALGSPWRPSSTHLHIDHSTRMFTSLAFLPSFSFFRTRKTPPSPAPTSSTLRCTCRRPRSGLSAARPSSPPSAMAPSCWCLAPPSAWSESSWELRTPWLPGFTWLPGWQRRYSPASGSPGSSSRQG